MGASRSEEQVGHPGPEKIVNSGFAGEIHPVNPEAGKIFGLQFSGSVTESPGDVGLAEIVVPAETFLDAM